MKIRDVINTHSSLAEAHRILRTKEKLSDEEKRFKEAIESAMKLCDYIYDNTDFCGVMKND